MEVLSSRVLLRPTDYERSRHFYCELLGLHVYREYGTGPAHGIVLFVGGGFLELSGEGAPAGTEKLALWLQVPDLQASHRELAAAGADIAEPPVRKPWGLDEMRVRDPDGITIVMVEVPEDHPLRRRV